MSDEQKLPGTPKAKVRRLKLYTKSGDKGKTSLYDGSRKYKEDYIFDVLGTIDELNCHVGALAVSQDMVIDFLREIQYHLTHIASVIATPHRNKNLPDITEGDIARLEGVIDGLQASTPPLGERSPEK